MPRASMNTNPHYNRLLLAITRMLKRSCTESLLKSIRRIRPRYGDFLRTPCFSKVDAKVPVLERWILLYSLFRGRQSACLLLTAGAQSTSHVSELYRKFEKHIPRKWNCGVLFPIATFMYPGAIFPQSILFGISFTLKAKKKLTTRINCFPLMIRNFPN